MWGPRRRKRKGCFLPAAIDLQHFSRTGQTISVPGPSPPLLLCQVAVFPAVPPLRARRCARHCQAERCHKGCQKNVRRYAKNARNNIGNIVNRYARMNIRNDARNNAGKNSLVPTAPEWLCAWCPAVSAARAGECLADESFVQKNKRHKTYAGNNDSRYARNSA